MNPSDGSPLTMNQTSKAGRIGTFFQSLPKPKSKDNLSDEEQKAYLKRSRDEKASSKSSIPSREYLSKPA
jgi:hypothetical protein